MQSIAETCVRFDAAHLSINLVSEIAVPMFTTLTVDTGYKLSRRGLCTVISPSAMNFTCYSKGGGGGGGGYFRNSLH